MCSQMTHAHDHNVGFFLPSEGFFSLYRFSPGKEQQACSHGNAEASDWQPAVSVLPLPNPHRTSSCSVIILNIEPLWSQAALRVEIHGKRSAPSTRSGTVPWSQAFLKTNLQDSWALFWASERDASRCRKLHSRFQIKCWISVFLTALLRERWILKRPQEGYVTESVPGSLKLWHFTDPLSQNGFQMTLMN